MSKIYIISPAHIATGGTELLQQLCFKLREHKMDSSIYYTEEFEGSPVQKKFTIYGNPYVNMVDDEEGNVVIVPETRIEYARKFKKAVVYIWWLSVDNYYGSFRRKVNLLHNIVYKFRDLKNKKCFKNSYHLVQSMYAKDFLVQEKRISEERVYYLSDYLNDQYIKETSNNRGIKENRVLYNPKKGFEFTKKIINKLDNYDCIPLENLKNEEMKDILCSSKVYLDFGNHPGKDRIPREAAVSGCCIITGKRGAAKNQYDINIPSKYKFDDSENEINNIIKTIDKCMNEYEHEVKNFCGYIDKIYNEEEKFDNDVLKIFGKYKE